MSSHAIANSYCSLLYTAFSLHASGDQLISDESNRLVLTSWPKVGTLRYFALKSAVIVIIAVYYLCQGGYVLPSVYACKLHGSMFYSAGVIPMEVLRCENRNFHLFCVCDLDLDSMTFIYELGPYSLEIYRMCKYELLTLWLLKLIV